MNSIICSDAQQAANQYNRKWSPQALNKLSTLDENTQVQYQVNPYFTWLMEHWCKPTCGIGSSNNVMATQNTIPTVIVKPIVVSAAVEEKEEKEDVIFDIFA